jgi:hypothetical protein
MEKKRIRLLPKEFVEEQVMPEYSIIYESAAIGI